MPPTLILVNPWIYDFAAYDLWSRPLGLLCLAAHLRNIGFSVHLIDCLDSSTTGGAPSSRVAARGPYGTGKFLRDRAARPYPLKDIPRSYSRYGISPQLFVRALEAVRQPAALLTTCLMTYWYPGVQEVIRLFRKTHPGVPVILGGTYARLCTEHAVQRTGADHVVTKAGGDAVQSVLEILEGYGVSAPSPPGGRAVYPALDFYARLEYAPMLTSTGCPFRCSYCASKVLYPLVQRRDPYDVLEEILFWHERSGVCDFAFYDDALLAAPETHAAVFLEEIARRRLPIRFHTPNALHAGEIDPDMAGLLLRAGFKTIRLGLETSDTALHHRTGNKIRLEDFERAVGSLLAAGFGRGDIGAYVLMGLPGQRVRSVTETVLFAERAGAMPYLAEYSPIPHTALWDEARACSELDLASEPLFHNNSLLPCWDDGQRSRVPELRALVRRIRHG
jgi:radical SAM superfamily enzyme YgiQ (UPF0313 family)